LHMNILVLITLLLYNLILASLVLIWNSIFGALFKCMDQHDVDSFSAGSK